MSSVSMQVADRRTIQQGKGVSIERRYTRRGQDPLAGMKFERRRSVITNPDGSVVFKMDDVEVPATWSQLATDILVSKYFRKAEVPGTGHEVSARQVVERIVKAIRQAGERLGGYFASDEDAQAFEDELVYMLMNQIGAFNSPVWFNCGLKEAYGIAGKPVGSWVWDQALGEVRETTDSYTNPQVSACFIQSIDDDLMDIAEGIQREMRLFKFGSGTGTNFSRIRAEGERLTSGGTSSGLMSFLEIFDKSAGAIKSGGTTRRAAKMVCLDMDHPDIVRFVEWKAREEDKVRALIKAGYSSDFNGEAYRTVSGQNSNNSVRMSDDFMQAVVEGQQWTTTWRTNGKAARTYPARELMRKVAEAAWRCADPGVQYDTTCNAWHTVPNAGRINATNPCSEFVFLDDTACNLASVNLLKFQRDDAGFDVEALRHACRTFIVAQEILVDYASYPTKRIAQRSHEFRPLGLGYANLGSLLLVLGQPYDSPQARATGGAITAIMTGAAYEASAEMAASKGPFAGFAHNREPMLKVMNMHRDAAYRLDAAQAAPALIEGARAAWDRAVAAGMRHGYRNAQATVLAPTGTIGLLMDCDTTGVEPDFALVKFKKLAGGGSFKIVNSTVSRGLRNLGYTQREVDDIVAYMRGTWSLEGAPHVNRQSLLAKGLRADELDRAEQALPSAFELRHAFSRHVLGDEALRRLGFGDKLEDPSFDLLRALGFTDAQVEAASEVTSGRLTIEGAPHLKPEHLPIFDCANRCGKTGTRSIAPMGHVRMMAAAQPFLSGAISKTVNLPPETAVEEIEQVYIEGWRLGLKAIAVYRDGSKASQVLHTSAKENEEKAEEKKAAAPALDVSTATAVPAGTPPRLVRRRLPKKRGGFTQEARVGGQKIYLRTGEYEDGTLGEVFIDLAKEGAALRSLMNCFAISVSLGLQHGVPLEEFVNAFTFTRFEPQGRVLDHPNIKFATSAVDYVFRVLGMEYLGRTDFVHVKPSDSDLEDEQAVAGDPAAEAALEAPAAPGAQVQPAPAQPRAITPGAAKNRLEGLSALAQNLMGDAPFCGSCGHITVRNGACYRCLNCGNSMGCS
ncbi:MAG: vitamin B12-dependent ribonucleotide reductase [Planctomycetes bacterium]|nr:vitamin B12-dependent ribonucleotide reductase [Planctomycetota bacterium]